MTKNKNKKKTALINENVIRRWGKLAAMPALTENYLETMTEEDDLEMEDEVVDLAGDMEGAEEMDAEVEMDMEAESGPQLPLSADQVEVLVQGIADKLSELTGEQVDVANAEELGDEEAAMDMDAEVSLDDLVDDEAAMRDAVPYNRDDKELNLEVVDDENLTEVVLKRVVERLLSRKQFLLMTNQLKKDDLQNLIREVVFSLKEGNHGWLLESPIPKSTDTGTPLPSRLP